MGAWLEHARLDGHRASGVAGVDRPVWLDQQDFCLRSRVGAMLDTTLHHEQSHAGV